MKTDMLVCLFEKEFLFILSANIFLNPGSVCVLHVSTWSQDRDLNIPVAASEQLFNTVCFVRKDIWGTKKTHSSPGIACVN